jgi:diguanylate cyclase (GGDEF)-like protein
MPKFSASSELVARAVPLADRLYWVGAHLPGDRFQCHAYLLENGSDSVLFDPGSALTFAQTLHAIEDVIPFSRIRYFVCHHQDPDITGAMPLIDQLIARPDAVLVTHWRAAVLLKHLGLRLPFWEVDKHGWQLELDGGRTLEFVFTPYCHFPGAFTSFDRQTGTLFSSDLFGGFTDDPGLYAEDESYFEAMRPFHEHYMPSREHLLSSLVALEKLPIRTIAPQHGRVIPGRLVPYIMERLKNLDCGLFLFSRKESEVERLMALTEVLRASLDAIVVSRDFSEVASVLVAQARRLLPVRALEFWSGPSDALERHAPDTRYRGEPAPAPAWLDGLMGAEREAWQQARGDRPLALHDADGDAFALPLFGADGVARAVALLRLEQATDLTDDVASILAKLAGPLAVAMERETIQQRVEEERDRLYERSIRDSLTGLYTRRYLDDAARHLLERHRRDRGAAFGVMMLDLDHFKRVNDTYGHPAGDAVLREVAARILGVTRGGDIVVRYGGEEIAAVVHAATIEELAAYGERVRRTIAGTPIETAAGPLSVTASLGVALHGMGEPLDALVRRADQALYQAKRGGRDRVGVAR